MAQKRIYSNTLLEDFSKKKPDVIEELTRINQFFKK